VSCYCVVLQSALVLVKCVIKLISGSVNITLSHVLLMINKQLQPVYSLLVTELYCDCRIRMLKGTFYYYQAIIVEIKFYNSVYVGTVL